MKKAHTGRPEIIGGRLICTNKCAQPEGHFNIFGASWAITRTKIQKNYKLSNEKVHCRKVSATFSRSLKCGNFQGNCKFNFFADCFRKWENSLVTNIEHMQSRCMAGSAKKLSFLAIFCSAACARLLVHVRCPLTFSLTEKMRTPLRRVMQFRTLT